MTGPDYLLHGPGERTPGERERDRKLVRRLRYLQARRDYYRAGHALERLCAVTTAIEHDRTAALTALQEAITILETLDRPDMRCLPACQALESLLVAALAGDDGEAELVSVSEMAARHFPRFVPETLDGLLSVGAVVCLEQCMSADPNAWVAEAWGKTRGGRA